MSHDPVSERQQLAEIRARLMAAQAERPEDVTDVWADTQFQIHAMADVASLLEACERMQRDVETSRLAMRIRFAGAPRWEPNNGWVISISDAEDGDSNDPHGTTLREAIDWAQTLETRASGDRET